MLEVAEEEVAGEEVADEVELFVMVELEAVWVESLPSVRALQILVVTLLVVPISEAEQADFKQLVDAVVMAAWFSHWQA